ncbi:MAG: hypothetical protein PVF73_07180 [Bacteroidales bacterium]
MVRLVIILLLFAISGRFGCTQVAEMNWELDYEVYLKMENDSDYTYDIRELFHVTDLKDPEFTSEFVFYPVNPGENLSSREILSDTTGTVGNTLWSALHAKLGGGWVHFTNCIAYALETEALSLHEPIMKRPVTSWKPDPVTESWKRTRKWEYFIPVKQKPAVKEYRKRLKNGNPGDLSNLPESYIGLFLSTSDKEYYQLRDNRKLKELAEIDLVKVLLGANYLGQAQINYISNAVLTAVQNYSDNNLPSVLIFDDFDAAAATSLKLDGYYLESVVFRSSADLSEEEIVRRQKEIADIIETINEYNRKSFKKRLRSYYSN